MREAAPAGCWCTSHETWSSPESSQFLNIDCSYHWIRWSPNCKFFKLPACSWSRCSLVEVRASSIPSLKRKMSLNFRLFWAQKVVWLDEGYQPEIKANWWPAYPNLLFFWTPNTVISIRWITISSHTCSCASAPGGSSIPFTKRVKGFLETGILYQSW